MRRVLVLPHERNPRTATPATYCITDGSFKSISEFTKVMKRTRREDFKIYEQLLTNDQHVHIANIHGQIERHRASRIGKRRGARRVAVAIQSSAG